MFGLIEVHQGRDFGPMRHFWGGVSGSIIGTGGDLPGEISQGQEAPGESSPTKIKTHEAIFLPPSEQAQKERRKFEIYWHKNCYRTGGIFIFMARSSVNYCAGERKCRPDGNIEYFTENTHSTTFSGRAQDKFARGDFVAL